MKNVSEMIAILEITSKISESKLGQFKNRTRLYIEIKQNF
jgi:hypothetical protein